MKIPLIMFVVATIAWLFFGEFRTKMIKVIIQDDLLTVKKFGGLSAGKSYTYSEIDGFKISILNSAFERFSYRDELKETFT